MGWMDAERGRIPYEKKVPGETFLQAKQRVWRNKAARRGREAEIRAEVMQVMYKDADPLTRREKDAVVHLTRNQRIVVSAVALSPKVVRRATLVTAIALGHMLRRLTDPTVNDEVKDKLAKIALEVAPKCVVAVRELIESAERNFEEMASLPGPAQDYRLPAEAEALLATSREIIGRRATKTG